MTSPRQEIRFRAGPDRLGSTDVTSILCRVQDLVPAPRYFSKGTGIRNSGSPAFLSQPPLAMKPLARARSAERHWGLQRQSQPASPQEERRWPRSWDIRGNFTLKFETDKSIQITLGEQAFRIGLRPCASGRILCSDWLRGSIARTGGIGRVFQCFWIS